VEHYDRVLDDHLLLKKIKKKKENSYEELRHKMLWFQLVLN